MRREQLVQSLQGWHGAGALGSPGSRPWSHTGGPAPWDGSVAVGLEGSTHPCQGLRSGACWAGARSWCCRCAWGADVAPAAGLSCREPVSRPFLTGPPLVSVLGPPAADSLSGWLGFPGREWAQLGGAVARAPGLHVVGPAASTLSDPLLCLRPIQ